MQNDLNYEVPYIDFRRATADDVCVMTNLRTAFLYEQQQYDAAIKPALADAISAYLQQGFADGSFAAWLAMDNGIVIATSGVTYYRLPPNAHNLTGNVAYISNMYTTPAYRKRGIAAALLHHCVVDSAAAGYPYIELNASKMGRSVYERYGFVGRENRMAYRVLEREFL